MWVARVCTPALLNSSRALLSPATWRYSQNHRVRLAPSRPSEPARAAGAPSPACAAAGSPGSSHCTQLGSGPLRRDPTRECQWQPRPRACRVLPRAPAPCGRVWGACQGGAVPWVGGRECGRHRRSRPPPRRLAPCRSRRHSTAQPAHVHCMHACVRAPLAAQRLAQCFPARVEARDTQAPPAAGRSSVCV